MRRAGDLRGGWAWARSFRCVHTAGADAAEKRDASLFVSARAGEEWDTSHFVYARAVCEWFVSHFVSARVREVFAHAYSKWVMSHLIFARECQRWVMSNFVSARASYKWDGSLFSEMRGFCPQNARFSITLLSVDAPFGAGMMS